MTALMARLGLLLGLAKIAEKRRVLVFSWHAEKR